MLLWSIHEEDVVAGLRERGLTANLTRRELDLVLDAWVEELGDDAGRGPQLGLLLARAGPGPAEVVEQEVGV